MAHTPQESTMLPTATLSPTVKRVASGPASVTSPVTRGRAPETRLSRVTQGVQVGVADAAVVHAYGDVIGTQVAPLKSHLPQRRRAAVPLAILWWPSFGLLYKQTVRFV